MPSGDQRAPNQLARGEIALRWPNATSTADSKGKTRLDPGGFRVPTERVHSLLVEPTVIPDNCSILSIVNILSFSPPLINRKREYAS